MGPPPRSGASAPPRLPLPRLALFDLDGTLVDSAPDLAYCVDETLHELGLPRRGEARIRPWIGDGQERLIKRALLDRHDGEPDPVLFALAFGRFRALYSVYYHRQTRLYPGVREALDHLKGRGVPLGCVTNKNGQFTLPLLRSIGLLTDFAVIVCGDTVPVKKPDPAPLLYAVEQLGVTAAECLMVGDSANDVGAARRAGMACVCVGYGYHRGRDLLAEGAVVVLDSLADLIPLLEA